MLNILNHSRYPTLDLHGETRDTVYALLKVFIEDNVKLKNEIVVIIHGKSSNILKNEVHQNLSKMKIVLDYHLDFWNNGATIVKIKI